MFELNILYQTDETNRKNNIKKKIILCTKRKLKKKNHNKHPQRYKERFCISETRTGNSFKCWKLKYFSRSEKKSNKRLRDKLEKLFQNEKQNVKDGS